MAFFEKVKQIATGRTEAERRQLAAANAQIRQKVFAAELREREKQSIRLSEESIRAKAEMKLKQIRNPKPMGGFLSPVNSGMNYGIGGFGQPIKTPKTKSRYVYVKKGKRYIRKKVSGPKMVRPQISQPQKRWDPIMGGWR